jgi:hypothetical protein
MKYFDYNTLKYLRSRMITEYFDHNTLKHIRLQNILTKVYVSIQKIVILWIISTVIF